MSRPLLVVFTALAVAVLAGGMLLAAPVNLAHIQAVHMLATQIPARQTSLEPAMPYFRGLVDQKSGDMRSAEAEFKAALQTRHEPFAGAHLVQIWLAQDRYGEILAFLQTGQRLEEGFARILIASSIVKVPATESQRWFEVVEARYPGALLRASQELVRAGRYSEAAQWSNAVSDASQKMEALLVSGISNFYQGHLEQAETIFQQVFQEKRTADVDYWYGRLLTLNGRPQQAVPILEESVRQASSGLLPWALRELGSAYALAGQCKDADDAFKRSIQTENSADNQERIRQARDNVKNSCVAWQ